MKFMSVPTVGAGPWRRGGQKARIVPWQTAVDMRFRLIHGPIYLSGFGPVSEKLSELFAQSSDAESDESLST